MGRNRYWIVSIVIVSMVFLVGSAFAMTAPEIRGKGAEGLEGAEHSRIRISHPKRGQTVSGYFIPVSWRDASVEQGVSPYPENYQTSQKRYKVMVLDRGDVVLEKDVEKLNYVVFTIKEIKDVLEKKSYRLRIIDLESNSFSPPIRFFYDKPEMDDATLEELQKLSSPQEEGVPTPEAEDGQFTSLINAYAAVSTSSYTSCPTCYSHYWPGMVVFYVRYPTTYSKKLYIYCGSSKYYEETLSPSFTGPVFTSMISGYNYNAIYWDGVILGNRCVNIKAFDYTYVLFP